MNVDNFNINMIKEEKKRYEIFLKKYYDKFDVIEKKHDSYISQLITLEGVIFGAVVIFTSSDQFTFWLILAVCFILLSLIFGILRQSISIKGDYESQTWNYKFELESHWSLREIWKDDSVKNEKDFFKPKLDKKEEYTRNKFSYKILRFLHLDLDKIEFIFVVTFILSLFFLIINLIFRVPILLRP